MTNIPTLWNEGGPSGAGYSELEPYLRCPKEYQYAKVRQITKPTAQTPDYFAVGSFVHVGRARWFASGFGLGAEVWDAIRRDVDVARTNLPLPSSEQSVSDALRYLQEYVDHWGIREKPKIVAVEHLLGPSDLLDGADSARTARLDDFGFYPEAGGALCIGECKTTTAPISDVANQYTVHGQPALQRLLWDLAPQGAATFGPVAGMVLDVIQKGYGGKRCSFSRIFVPHDERVQLWAKSSLAKATMAKNALAWDSGAERRITSCTRLIGKARVACQYRDLCQIGKAGSQGYVFADGRSITEWQPSEGRQTAAWD
jgi:hypothetical protein